LALAGLVVGLKLRLVMSMVPDITAGTGTEFEETLVCSGSGGLSESEGQEEYCGNPRPNRQATFR
jgi:hypothetical protein